MTFEYRAKITVTERMAGNGAVSSKSYNGTCSFGLNKRAKGSIAQKAEAYLQAVEHSLGSAKKASSPKKPVVPRMEVMSRVAAIPVVESGLGLSQKFYVKIRESNPLIRWYLSLGERSLATGVRLALPAVLLLERPISQLDFFLCKSLDVVERRMPSIYLPPEMMYTETRRYVMRRADSVKQIGTAVLDSRVTVATAVVVDRALTTADKYVDKYLPPDHQDVADVTGPDEVDGGGAGGGAGGVVGTGVEGGRARAVQAVQHGVRLRKKLQRRLTRQALAEAKAIKEQIHVLAYVAELVAKDPVLAWQKTKELYMSLSKPEPENQARPTTLEEMLVLLAREAARRVVHLVNYTHTDLPRNVKQGMTVVSGHMLFAADVLLKVLTLLDYDDLQSTTVHLDSALGELKGLRSRLEALLQQLQSTSKSYLEHMAIFLAGNEEREKIAPHSVYSDQRDDLAINGVN